MKRPLKRRMARAIQSGLLVLILATPTLCKADWQLVWSDEFDQPDGSVPDSTKWSYDTGGGGWGNNELEYYTSRTNNVRIVGGQLVIEADQESFGGSSYTSGRLLTQDKWSWTYGRIEARIRIPRGQGIWPAFWMLGNNIGSVGWPTCGEIDIMENIGKTSDQGTDHGTIHGPQSGGDYNGGAGVSGTYTLPGGVALADDFHVYAVEWTTNKIQWFVDTNLYFTVTPASLSGGSTWVFTQPEFLTLNVAVGGNWPGYPDGTTVFPQQMLVDYVRVYSNVAVQTNSPIALTVQSGGLANWPTTIGTMWTLQSTSDGNTWSNCLGPTAGDGTTNIFFDPNWPAQHAQYQVLETTFATGNIVVNGGFETGGGLVASNWSSSGSQLPVRVSTDARGGSYSMQLLVTNVATTPNSSEIDQNVGMAGGTPVIAGQTYTFSFWAKQISSGVSYVQNYGIAWLNSSGGTVGSVGLTGFSAGSGVWSQFLVNNLVAPANAVNASLKIYGATGAVKNGSGGVLIDDVALSFATASETNIVAATMQPCVQVSWPSTVGNLYDVQRTKNVGGNNWSNLVSSVVGNGNTNTVSDTLGTNQYLFYRVVQH
jgi:beta-glucanase (GH16 family)